MKAGWTAKRFGDICAFEKVQGMHKNLPYVGLEDIASNTGQFIGSKNNQLVKSATFRFTPQCILYGRLRPYLNKALLPDFDGHCSTEIFPIKPAEGVTREFLFHWLTSEATMQAIDKTATGARMPRANMNAVLDFELLVPPRSEQQRIVAILDEAFDGIATVKANAEKNLQNARELLESHLSSVFGKPPQGWVRKKLCEVCEKITDGTHQTPTYFDDGFVFLSSRNVTSGTIDWGRIKFIDEKQHIAMQKRVAPRVNDILLAKNGTTGVAAMVDRDISFDIYVSLALLRAREVILPSYLLHFINSLVAKEQFNKRLKGTGVPNLHLEEIREVSICFPSSLDSQQNVVGKLDVLKAETQHLESLYQQKLAALDELKKSLLHQAFSGEL